jgi:hypothetical protein
MLLMVMLCLAHKNQDRLSTNTPTRDLRSDWERVLSRREMVTRKVGHGSPSARALANVIDLADFPLRRQTTTRASQHRDRQGLSATRGLPTKTEVLKIEDVFRAVDHQSLSTHYGSANVPVSNHRRSLNVRNSLPGIARLNRASSSASARYRLLHPVVLVLGASAGTARSTLRLPIALWMDPRNIGVRTWPRQTSTD